MIGIVATLKVQEGKNAEFEAIFKELTAKVRANEPGNLAYQLCRSRTDANTYKVLELYADTAAQDAHRGSEHFRDLGRKMGAYIDGRPDIELLDGVV
jgi:quinol monooxygenase YgiN